MNSRQERPPRAAGDHPAATARFRAGLGVARVGDAGPLPYEKRRGDAEAERATVHALRRSGAGRRVFEFFAPGKTSPPR